ncbi:intercellular adhesion molecule 2-like isoform X2 [Leuresthes tenuis]|uniref:intercellular adhesion molecule 2-like isoform X2 n=1 Tax=Leuresthes tenuis TaxID=355514 RepID=UPI003B508879
MCALGRLITLVLFCLFGSATSSPVIIHTLAPALPPQISPPSPMPTLLLSPTSPVAGSSEESTERAECHLNISSSTLVVRFGDPVKANCSKQGIGFPFLGWKVSLEAPEVTMEDFLVWSVDKMTDWSIKPTCYAASDLGGQCAKELSLMVYQPPNRVSIRFVNHTGPMFEGHQYILQCTVHDVAPVENITVTFYRGQTALAQLQSNITKKTPVNESFTMSIIPCKEHNRTKFWCEAKLELGPDGPQQPPVVKSEKISALVHNSQLVHPTNQQVKDSFKCKVKGNPPPLEDSGTTNSSKGCFLLAVLLAQMISGL